MGEVTRPNIQPSTNETCPNPSFPPSTSYTRITFSPDLSALKIPGDRIPHGDYVAMCRRVLDVAGTTAFKEVMLNGRELQLPDFLSYTAMFGSDCVYQKVNERWEVALIPSRGEDGHVISFVNSIATTRGGTHVNNATSQIVKAVQSHIAKKHPSLPSPSPSLIKSHLILFLNGKVEDPSFDSQSKEMLTTPVKDFGSTCTLSSQFLSSVIASDVVKNILQHLENSDMKKFSKVGIFFFLSFFLSFFLARAWRDNCLPSERY